MAEPLRQLGDVRRPVVGVVRHHQDRFRYADQGQLFAFAVEPTQPAPFFQRPAQFDGQAGLALTARPRQQGDADSLVIKRPCRQLVQLGATSPGWHHPGARTEQLGR